MKHENIFITKGIAYVKDITLMSCTGVPVDISNYAFAIRIAKHVESASKFSGGTFTIVSGMGGQVKLVLSSTETSNLPSGALVYSITATNLIDQTLILVMHGQAFVEAIA